MNKVTLLGRLTDNPIFKIVGEKNYEVATATIAVDRKFSGKNKERETDFIELEMWGKRAKYFEQYLNKGERVLIEGRLRIIKYPKSENPYNKKVRVIVENFEFADGGKKQSVKTEKASNYFIADDIFESVDESGEKDTILSVNENE